MTTRYTTATLGALLMAGMLNAQGATGTTTVSVAIAAEASLNITTGSTALTTSGTTFSNPFTGSTSLTYKIRTTKVGGSGTITLKVTSDFSPANGPSVATPPTGGDALTYTCTLAAPGTACTGSLTSSTTASTSVGTFGTDAKSTSGGNTGTINWSLTNDPLYSTGSYSATVTFTIAAL
ncbi:MAG: hypothetical protein LAP87_24865 [Acidobacteriia bacterium]|nr:hypothetical protein [Terriglobia bacterium]